MQLPTWMTERIKQLGDTVVGRPLTGTERALAHSVFVDSVPYGRVAITNLNLGGAVTLCDTGLDGKGPIYTINWVDGFQTTQRPLDRQATLIHELTHVWQGHNGLLPPLYMGRSIWAQLSAGVRDIWRKREMARLGRASQHRV